jgi:hypothetical protein
MWLGPGADVPGKAVERTAISTAGRIAAEANSPLNGCSTMIVSPRRPSEAAAAAEVRSALTSRAMVSQHAWSSHMLSAAGPAMGDGSRTSSSAEGAVVVGAPLGAKVGGVLSSSDGGGLGVADGEVVSGSDGAGLGATDGASVAVAVLLASSVAAMGGGEGVADGAANSIGPCDTGGSGAPSSVGESGALGMEDGAAKGCAEVLHVGENSAVGGHAYDGARGPRQIEQASHILRSCRHVGFKI